MEENQLVLSADNIKRKIYTIRDVQVMLDEDLAELYNVETLTEDEFENLMSQFVTLNKGCGSHRKNLSKIGFDM